MLSRVSVAELGGNTEVSLPDLCSPLLNSARDLRLHATLDLHNTPQSRTGQATLWVM